MTHRASFLAVLAASTLLTACGGPQVVAPGGTIQLSFAATANVNPAPDGTANPVQVRIYSLKSRDKFMNTDYYQLADKDRATLGGDLLFRQDVTVRPGATQTVATTVLPGQTLLGFAVGFRNIDHSTWRLTAPLLSPQSFRLEADKVVPVK